MAGQEWRSAIQQGHWTDRDGGQWHRRGEGPVGKKVARRLVTRPDIRVHLVVPFEEDRDIPLGEREQFWNSIESQVERDPHPHGSFPVTVGEFRDDDGQRLLMFEIERC